MTGNIPTYLPPCKNHYCSFKLKFKRTIMDINANQDRVESAFRTVETFSALTDIESKDMDVKITDLLCNLHDLADDHGVDLEE